MSDRNATVMYGTLFRVSCTVEKQAANQTSGGGSSGVDSGTPEAVTTGACGEKPFSRESDALCVARAAAFPAFASGGIGAAVMFILTLIFQIVYCRCPVRLLFSRSACLRSLTDCRCRK